MILFPGLHHQTSREAVHFQETRPESTFATSKLQRGHHRRITLNPKKAPDVSRHFFTNRRWIAVITTRPDIAFAVSRICRFRTPESSTTRRASPRSLRCPAWQNNNKNTKEISRESPGRSVRVGALIFTGWARLQVCGVFANYLGGGKSRPAPKLRPSPANWRQILLGP